MSEIIHDGIVHAPGKSGALTSGSRPSYWQVPRSYIDAAARRFDKGTESGKYPIQNWRAGLSDSAFLRDRADHLFYHLMQLLNGVEDENDDAQGNADAVACNLAMLVEALSVDPTTFRATFYNEPRGEKVQ